MAVDGSFCLQSELRRFLDRRPKLKSVSRFSNLLNKGNLVTEDEVVDAVGQLLLHPKYTIPLLGCLRPISERIVESTAKLVHSARKLMPDDDFMEEFDEEEFLRDSENVYGAEITNIIDIYVSRRKGLRLHELACLAFYRALDLIPFLLGSILKYFEDAPAPFKRFVRCETFSKTDAKGSNRLLNVVRASYGLLMMETDIFMSFWDWSCYLDLLQMYPNSVSLDNVSDMRFNDELREIVSDIRWCSIEILSLVLGLSFEASANLGRDSKQSIHSLLRWQEFCMEVSLEKGKNLLGAIWRKVMIGSPNDDDILNIVLEWFPERDSLAKKVIESFKRIVQLTRFQLGLTASSSYHDRFTLRRRQLNF